MSCKGGRSFTSVWYIAGAYEWRSREGACNSGSIQILIGASLNEPHIVVLFRMSVRVSVQFVSSWMVSDLAYDRISKCKIVMLRRPPACLGQDAYKSPARPYRVEPAYALRWCYKLRSYYRLAQVSWRERFSQGTPLRYSVASFPRPTPSFSLLAVRTVGQATKSWAWDWERGYHKLETAAADRQW